MLLKVMLAVAVDGSFAVMFVFNHARIASMAAPLSVGIVC